MEMLRKEKQRGKRISRRFYEEMLDMIKNYEESRKA